MQKRRLVLFGQTTVYARPLEPTDTNTMRQLQPYKACPSGQAPLWEGVQMWDVVCRTKI